MSPPHLGRDGEGVIVRDSETCQENYQQKNEKTYKDALEGEVVDEEAALARQPP